MPEMWDNIPEHLRQRAHVAAAKAAGAKADTDGRLVTPTIRIDENRMMVVTWPPGVQSAQVTREVVDQFVQDHNDLARARRRLLALRQVVSDTRFDHPRLLMELKRVLDEP